MEIWKPCSIPPDQWHMATIGPLAIRLRRRTDEWHIATERLDETQHSGDMQPFAPCDPPDNAEWQRWIVSEDTGTARLLPVMPDHPVVVRPESPLNIPSGAQALFFVSIPIWLRIIAQNGEPVTLCEEPTIILSHTWFGEPTGGEFCYALPSTARRGVDQAAQRPYRAICPVKLVNAGPKQLAFERLCIQAEGLAVYKGASHLWTNQINVTSKAADEPNVVTFEKEPPSGESSAFEEIGEMLSEPRKRVNKSLLQKSFGAFRMFGI